MSEHNRIASSSPLPPPLRPLSQNDTTSVSPWRTVRRCVVAVRHQCSRMRWRRQALREANANTLERGARGRTRGFWHACHRQRVRVWSSVYDGLRALVEEDTMTTTSSSSSSSAAAALTQAPAWPYDGSASLRSSTSLRAITSPRSSTSLRSGGTPFNSHSRRLDSTRRRTGATGGGYWEEEDDEGEVNAHVDQAADHKLGDGDDHDYDKTSDLDGDGAATTTTITAAAGATSTEDGADMSCGGGEGSDKGVQLVLDVGSLGAWPVTTARRARRAMSTVASRTHGAPRRPSRPPSTYVTTATTGESETDRFITTTGSPSGTEVWVRTATESPDGGSALNRESYLRRTPSSSPATVTLTAREAGSPLSTSPKAAATLSSHNTTTTTTTNNNNAVQELIFRLAHGALASLTGSPMSPSSASALRWWAAPARLLALVVCVLAIVLSSVLFTVGMFNCTYFLRGRLCHRPGQEARYYTTTSTCTAARLGEDQTAAVSRQYTLSLRTQRMWMAEAYDDLYAAMAALSDKDKDIDKGIESRHHENTTNHTTPSKRLCEAERRLARAFTPLTAARASHTNTVPRGAVDHNTTAFSDAHHRSKNSHTAPSAALPYSRQHVLSLEVRVHALLEARRGTWQPHWTTTDANRSATHSADMSHGQAQHAQNAASLSSHASAPVRVRFATYTNNISPTGCTLLASAALSGVHYTLLGFEQAYGHLARHLAQIEWIAREGLADEDVVVLTDSDAAWTGVDVAPFLAKFIDLSPAHEAVLDVAKVRAWEDYGEALAAVVMAEQRRDELLRDDDDHDEDYDDDDEEEITLTSSASSTAHVDKVTASSHTRLRRRWGRLVQMPPILFNAESSCQRSHAVADEAQCQSEADLLELMIATRRNRPASMEDTLLAFLQPWTRDAEEDQSVELEESSRAFLTRARPVLRGSFSGVSTASFAEPERPVAHTLSAAVEDVRQSIARAARSGTPNANNNNNNHHQQHHQPVSDPQDCAPPRPLFWGVEQRASSLPNPDKTHHANTSSAHLVSLFHYLDGATRLDVSRTALAGRGTARCAPRPTWTGASDAPTKTQAIPRRLADPAAEPQPHPTSITSTRSTINENNTVTDASVPSTLLPSRVHDSTPSSFHASPVTLSAVDSARSSAHSSAHSVPVEQEEVMVDRYRVDMEEEDDLETETILLPLPDKRVDTADVVAGASPTAVSSPAASHLSPRPAKMEGDDNDNVTAVVVDTEMTRARASSATLDSTPTAFTTTPTTITSTSAGRLPSTVSPFDLLSDVLARDRNSERTPSQAESDASGHWTRTPTQPSGPPTSSDTPLTGGVGGGGGGGGDAVPPAHKYRPRRTAERHPSDADYFFPNLRGSLNAARHLNAGGLITRVWAYKQLVRAMLTYTEEHFPLDLSEANGDLTRWLKIHGGRPLPLSATAQHALFGTESPFRTSEKAHVAKNTTTTTTTTTTEVVPSPSSALNASKDANTSSPSPSCRAHAQERGWYNDQAIIASMYVYGRIWEVEEDLLMAPFIPARAASHSRTNGTNTRREENGHGLHPNVTHVARRRDPFGLPPGLMGIDRASEFFFVTPFTEPGHHYVVRTNLDAGAVMSSGATERSDPTWTTKSDLSLSASTLAEQKKKETTTTTHTTTTHTTTTHTTVHHWLRRARHLVEAFLTAPLGLLWETDASAKSAMPARAFVREGGHGIRAVEAALTLSMAGLSGPKELDASSVGALICPLYLFVETVRHDEVSWGGDNRAGVWPLPPSPVAAHATTPDVRAAFYRPLFPFHHRQHINEAADQGDDCADGTRSDLTRRSGISESKASSTMRRLHSLTTPNTSGILARESHANSPRAARPSANLDSPDLVRAASSVSKNTNNNHTRAMKGNGGGGGELPKDADAHLSAEKDTPNVLTKTTTAGVYTAVVTPPLFARRANTQDALRTLSTTPTSSAMPGTLERARRLAELWQRTKSALQKRSSSSPSSELFPSLAAKSPASGEETETARYLRQFRRGAPDRANESIYYIYPDEEERARAVLSRENRCLLNLVAQRWLTATNTTRAASAAAAHTKEERVSSSSSSPAQHARAGSDTVHSGATERDDAVQDRHAREFEAAWVRCASALLSAAPSHPVALNYTTIRPTEPPFSTFSDSRHAMRGDDEEDEIEIDSPDADWRHRVLRSCVLPTAPLPLTARAVSPPSSSSPSVLSALWASTDEEAMAEVAARNQLWQMHGVDVATFPRMLHFAGDWKDIRYREHRHGFSWFVTGQYNRTARAYNEGVLKALEVEWVSEETAHYFSYEGLCGLPYGLI